MSTQSEYFIRNREGEYLQDRNNSYAIVKEKSKASRWSLQKAHNRAKSLPKLIQSRGPWYIELCTDSFTGIDEEDLEEINVAQILPSVTKPAHSEFNTRCNPSVISHFHYEVPPEVLNWTNAVSNIAKLQQSTAEKLTELRLRLQESEYERIDILHLIELQPSLNMYEGYKLYKRLRENLHARRVVKDEIQAIKVFVESISISELAESSVTEFLRVLEKRKYHVRVKDAFSESDEDTNDDEDDEDLKTT